MNIYDALILKAVGGGGGTTVVANPEGEATDELEKLQVGNDIYGIPKDYEEMSNKPSINSVELSGNKTASELGLQPTLDGAQTVEGNPITVTDAESMNAESVVVELEPKQDLHGYDAPWVGGARKNKLPLVLADIKSANTSGTWSGNVYTDNGVTFTIMTDNSGNVVSININGTCTSEFYLFLCDSLQNVLISGTSYKLNGCPPNGSNTTYGIGLLDPVTFGAYWDYGEGVSFTYSSNVKSARILIRGGVSINNLVFKPMIRLDTETDPTFAPYSNICPITGYSEVNVERVRKNWLDSSYLVGFNESGLNVVNNNGVLSITGNVSSAFNKRLATGVPIKAGTYIISKGSSNKYPQFLISYNDQYIAYVGTTEQTIIIQTDGVINIDMYTDSGNYSDTFYPMIRLATETDPTYEPYQGSTATISLGGTKYGGTLDVTEGGYSDEWGYISGSSVSDLVSAGMSSDTTSAGLYCMVLGSSAVPQADDQTATSDKLVCNDMENINANQSWGTNVSGICINQVGHVIFTVKDITTQADMDTWLSNNPIQIAYRKKTPSSVSTTPTDIPLLENTNNISTDGTNITLKYQPNNVIGECKAYTDEECAKVLPPLPTTDGTYHLSCEVTSGVGVLSWVSDS